MTDSHDSKSRPGTADLCAELLESLGGIVSAEVQLAETKITHRLGLTSSQILLGLLIFSVGLLGAGAMALSIILLVGRALDGRFWLSSLLLGLGLLGIGLPVTLWRFRKTKEIES